MINDRLEMSGKFEIEAIDNSTGEVLWTKNIKNQLMDINRQIRAQQLMGTYTGNGKELAIRYFAFGLGEAPITVNDTKLDREVYRKQITQISSPASGVVRSVVSLGSVEVNTTIKEIGVFCGSDATTATDTGLLLSRVLVNIEKNSNITLNIVRTDTCTI